MQFTLRCDERGEPAADELASSFVTDGAEQAFMRNPAQAAKLLTDEAIAAAPNDEARRRLRLLRDMKNPEPEPVDLATAKAARVFLSDARWTKAEVGWGKVARNRYWFHPGQWEGALLKLGGEVFAKASTRTRSPSSSFRSVETGKLFPPPSASAMALRPRAPPFSPSSATAGKSSAQSCSAPAKKKPCASTSPA